MAKTNKRLSDKEFNKSLGDIDSAVYGSKYGSTKGVNSMEWILRKRKMDARTRATERDENGNVIVNEGKAKEIEDYERRRDTPANTKFSIIRNGKTYSGTDVEKFSQDLKSRRGTTAAREFLASRGNKSMQDLLNSKGELLKKRDDARKDPNSLVGLSRDQVRDRGFEAYIHNIKNQDAKNQKELATSRGETRAATVGQRVRGATYDRFGMPVDPGPMSALDMNGLSDRERAQWKMEHGRSQQAYRTAMRIWRQENPEAARRGMTAQQFYKERYIMSDQYRTDQARARLENAVDASYRQQLNDIASQIEAHNFLNGRGPLQGELSRNKEAVTGANPVPKQGSASTSTTASEGKAPETPTPMTMDEYNRGMNKAFPLRELYTPTNNSQIEAHNFLNGRGPLQGELSRNKEAVTGANPVPKQGSASTSTTASEGKAPETPTPMTMDEYNRGMNKAFPLRELYTPTNNTDEINRQAGPRI